MFIASKRILHHRHFCTLGLWRQNQIVGSIWRKTKKNENDCWHSVVIFATFVVFIFVALTSNFHS